MEVVAAKILPKKEDSKLKFRLSVSKSKTFDDCKRKFKYNYLDKLPRKEWDHFVFGSFNHKYLEDFHEDLLQHPERESSWNDRLDVAWSSAVDEFKDMKPDQIEEARGIFNCYKEILEEDGLPDIVSVEEPFVIELDGQVLLNGFIDRVQMDPDGIIHVGDYKTTKNKKYMTDFFQLETYAYALMTKDPSIKKVRASYIMLRHEFDYITEEFTREEIMGKIAQKFIQYKKDIEEEKTWRANPQFLCKFCDFTDHCEEGTSFLIKRGLIQPKNTKHVKVGLDSW